MTHTGAGETVVPAARARAVPAGWAPALAVLAAAVVTYSGTLGHGFVWDDHLILRHIERAFTDHGLPGVLAAPFLPTAGVPNNYYRPVVYASYRLDQAMGEGRPRAAHRSNLAFHALAALLAFAFARRLLEDDTAALAAGLVFATHPVNVEAVAWVAGRTDVLCALFTLAAALAWLAAVSKPPSAGRRWLCAASGLLFVLACFSKEAAIALPLLLLLVPRGAASPPGQASPRWNLIGTWALTFLPAALLVFALRQAALHDELGHTGVLEQVQGSLLVREPAVAAGALLRQLRSLVIPWPHDALQTRSDVAPGVLTLLALAALALLAWASFRSRPRVTVVAVAWVTVFALPSLLVPSGGVVVGAERYAYLPSIGAAILLGTLAAPRSVARASTAARTAAVAVLALGLAAASFSRASVWANDVTLTADLVRTSPQSALAHQMRGDALLGQGRLEEAVRSYERAVSLDPASAPAHRSLGLALLRRGDPARASSALRRAVELEPDWPQPRVDLAMACAAVGNWDCVGQQREALREYPERLAALDRVLLGGR